MLRLLFHRDEEFGMARAGSVDAEAGGVARETRQQYWGWLAVVRAAPGRVNFLYLSGVHFLSLVIRSKGKSFYLSACGSCGSYCYSPRWWQGGGRFPAFWLFPLSFFVSPPLSLSLFSSEAGRGQSPSTQKASNTLSPEVNSRFLLFFSFSPDLCRRLDDFDETHPSLVH